MGTLINVGAIILGGLITLLFTAATWWVVTNDTPVGVQWSGFDVFGTPEPRRYVAALPASAGPISDCCPCR